MLRCPLSLCLRVCPFPNSPRFLSLEFPVTSQRPRLSIVYCLMSLPRFLSSHSLCIHTLALPPRRISQPVYNCAFVLVCLLNDPFLTFSERFVFALPIPKLSSWLYSFYTHIEIYTHEYNFILYVCSINLMLIRLIQLNTM